MLPLIVRLFSAFRFYSNPKPNIEIHNRKATITCPSKQRMVWHHGDVFLRPIAMQHLPGSIASKWKFAKLIEINAISGRWTRWGTNFSSKKNVAWITRIIVWRCFPVHWFYWKTPAILFTIFFATVNWLHKSQILYAYMNTSLFIFNALSAARTCTYLYDYAYRRVGKRKWSNNVLMYWAACAGVLYFSSAFIEIHSFEEFAHEISMNGEEGRGGRKSKDYPTALESRRKQCANRQWAFTYM